MTTQAIQAASASVPVQDISGLDLETALMTVQSTRTQLLDDQLKAQLNDVKARNDRISKLNGTLSSARNLQACFAADAKPDARVADLPKKDRENAEKTTKEEYKAKYEAMSDAEKKDALSSNNTGIDPGFVRMLGGKGYELISGYSDAMKAIKSTDNASTKSAVLMEQMKQEGAAAGITIDVKDKGSLDKLVENIKSVIDSESNSQQMDMLRLQSLSNKRNEAFDLMTNFIKKMQDSRSSILGNMR